MPRIFPIVFCGLIASVSLAAETGDTDARHSLEAGVREAPEKNAAALEALFAHYRRTGDLEAGAAFLHELVEEGELTELQGAIQTARLYLSAGKPREAVAALGEARRLAPDDPDVLRLFGRFYALQAKDFFERGDVANAELFWNRALEFDPDQVDAVLALGRRYVEAGEYARARELFERLVAADPPMADYYLLFSRALRELEQEDAARAVLRRGIDVLRAGDEPDAAESLNAALAELEAFEEPEAAPEVDPERLKGSLELLEETVAADPGNETARRALAEGYMMAENVRKALPVWTDLAETYPENRYYFDQALTVAMDLGDAAAAEPLLHRAVSRGLIAPVEKWLYLSRAHLRAGSLRRVPAMLRKAEELDPEHPGVRTQYGRYFHELGRQALAADRQDEAIAHFERSLDRVPENAEALLFLGNLYGMRRQWDRAAYYFETLLPFAPDEPGYYVRFAQLLIGQQRADRALREFRYKVEELRSAGDTEAAARLESGLRQLDYAVNLVRNR